MLNKESLQTSAEKALTPPHDPPPNHCVSRVAPRGFVVAWFRSFPGQSRARTFKPFVCVFKSIFLKKKKKKTTVQTPSGRVACLLLTKSFTAI